MQKDIVSLQVDKDMRNSCPRMWKKPLHFPTDDTHVLAMGLSRFMHKTLNTQRYSNSDHTKAAMDIEAIITLVCSQNARF